VNSLDLAVTGMTCGHCVSSVTEELGAIEGVESVSVQLNAGGVSTVTVASSSALNPAAVRAAVDEAGYSLVEA
jgi:copper chaperone